MRHKRLARIGAALFSTMLILSAAQAESNLKELQWYLGLGAGIAELEPETGGTSRVDDSSDIGIKVFAGYELTGRIKIEGYYSDLGSADIASPNGSIDYKSFGMSGLYYFFKERSSHVGWGIIGRVGIGRMKNSSNLSIVRDNDYHLLFGGGVEYGFKNGFALRTDVDFFDRDANLFGIYLLKRFGGDG